MVSVFLVDDYELVRRGLADLIDDEPDLTVVGQAGTMTDALARIPAARPDVAILDMRLPDGNGVELCRELRSRLPDLNCLILTSYTEQQAMVDAVLAGASGYLVKDITCVDLAAAIRTVASGRSLLDPLAVSALLVRLQNGSGAADRGPLAGLSDQETTVLGLIGEGLTNREIAGRMFVAEKTAKNYVSRLLSKLGMQRRTQAAVLATQVRDGVEHPTPAGWAVPANLTQ